jgi:hypothetical protein
LPGFALAGADEADQGRVALAQSAFDFGQNGGHFEGGDEVARATLVRGPELRHGVGASAFAGAG